MPLLRSCRIVLKTSISDGKPLVRGIASMSSLQALVHSSFVPNIDSHWKNAVMISEDEEIVCVLNLEKNAVTHQK